MTKNELENRLALLRTLIIRKDWQACRSWINQWEAAEKTETSAKSLHGSGAGSLPTNQNNR
jgi:hypothetical protein